MKTVLELGSVKLEQFESGMFCVTYGQQVGVPLEYEDAAKELGECLMHQAACYGLLDQE